MFTIVRSRLMGFSIVRLALVAGLLVAPWFGAPAPPAAAGPGDPGAAAGTTITVNTPLDELLNDGNCSLREAISAANTHTPSGAAAGECPAGSGTDTIVLPANTYLLTRVGPADDTNLNGDLDIASSLAIQGAGAGTTTIDGNSSVVHERVLHILSGDVAISGVTIRNGTQTANVGGGILSVGSLTLTGSVIRDNSAAQGAGINCVSALAVTDTDVFSNTASGSAGGIYTMSLLRLTNSTVSSNTAAAGSAGGIYALTGLTISGSSIFSNTAGGAGGGVFGQGAITVSDSDFSKNVASGPGGGVYLAFGSLILTQVNFANNQAKSGGQGGGIFANIVAGQPLTLDRVTVSGNTAAADGGGLYSIGGTPTLTGSSVISNTSGGSGGGMWVAGAGPAVMQLTNVDLSYNHASFAGGGGWFSAVAVDYRGGSVSHNQTNNGPGGGLYMAGGGPGVGLRLANVTVSNNTTSGAFMDGGGVYSQNSAEIHNSTISSNSAGGSGGGLWCGQTTTVEDSSIQGNTANGSGGAGNGGGVYCSGPLTINNTTISGNLAKGMSGNGGGIIALANVTLTNMTLSGNHAYGSGGGLDLAGSFHYSLNGLTIAGNVANDDNIGAADYGGGVYQANGVAVIKNSVLAGNMLFAAASDCFRAPPGINTSQDYNLIQTPDASCGFTAAHDLTNSDPLLLALADNGGATQTRGLGAGSPALNRIPNGSNGCGISPLDKDQRGFARPQPAGGQCDVGAYEDQSPAFSSLPVTVGHPTVTYSYAISTTDLDRLDGLAISAPDKPAWLTLTDNGNRTATLEGVPGWADAGSYSVTLQVQDSAGLTGTQAFVIAVPVSYGYVPVVIR